MRVSHPHDPELPPDDMSDMFASLIRDGFVQGWYMQTYRGDLSRHAMEGEAPYAFYLRRGARMGHDPNPYFSEIHYRQNNQDLQADMLRDDAVFGFAHYVRNRTGEGNMAPISQRTVQNLRMLALHLDETTIDRQLPPSRNSGISYVDRYIAACLSGRKIDPNPAFKEVFYRENNPDLQGRCGKGGDFISGFQHYLIWGQAEGRMIQSCREYRMRYAGLLGRLKLGRLKQKWRPV